MSLGKAKILSQGVAAVSCTTSTLNYPTGVTGTALYEFNSNTNSTSSSSYNSYSIHNLSFSTSVKKYGSASAVFNGSSTKINLPQNSLNFSEFSISAWVYISSNPASNAPYTILSTYDYQSGPSKGWTFQITNGQHVRFSGHAGDCSNPFPADPSCSVYTRIESTAQVPLNTWTFVALTNSGTGNAVTLWIGNSVVATTTMQSLSYHTNYPSLGYASYYVGSTAYSESFFAGNIDQLRVYNNVLTQGSITSLNNEVNC